MSKRYYAVILIAVVLPILGCAESSDGLVKKQIAQMNELADAIEAGADKAKTDSLEDAMKATNVALEELAISKEEKARLIKEYGEELTKAGLRLGKAKMKAGMEQMGGQLQGMMESVQEKMGDAIPKLPAGDMPMPKLP